jgi:hypothetical protein
MNVYIVEYLSLPSHETVLSQTAELTVPNSVFTHVEFRGACFNTMIFAAIQKGETKVWSVLFDIAKNKTPRHMSMLWKELERLVFSPQSSVIWLDLSGIKGHIPDYFCKFPLVLSPLNSNPCLYVKFKKEDNIFWSLRQMNRANRFNVFLFLATHCLKRFATVSISKLPIAHFKLMHKFLI